MEQEEYQGEIAIYTIGCTACKKPIDCLIRCEALNGKGKISLVEGDISLFCPQCRGNIRSEIKMERAKYFANKHGGKSGMEEGKRTRDDIEENMEDEEEYQEEIATSTITRRRPRYWIYLWHLKIRVPFCVWNWAGDNWKW